MVITKAWYAAMIMEWTSHTLARHESGSEIKTHDTSRSLRLSALSRYSASKGPVLNPFNNEIVQVATDGSDRVRRIAHHRSLVCVYEDQPKASISRDGRYVAFTSHWGVVNGRRDVYIVVNIPPAPTS
jgi:hypothetical protein